MTMKWESDLLIKTMIKDRIGLHKLLLPLFIVNITLSKDLRKDKKLSKGVNCFMILKFWFVNAVYITVRLQTVVIESQLVENTQSFKQIIFEESVIFNNYSLSLNWL